MKNLLLLGLLFACSSVGAQSGCRPSFLLYNCPPEEVENQRFELDEDGYIWEYGECNTVGYISDEDGGNKKVFPTRAYYWSRVGCIARIPVFEEIPMRVMRIVKTKNPGA